MDHSKVETMEKLEISSKMEFYEAAVEDDQTGTSVQQSYVTVLREEDIWRRMEYEIRMVSDVTCISKDEATLLVSQFNWDVSKLHNDWFDNAESIRASFGLLEKSFDPPSDDKEFVCGADLQPDHSEKFAYLSCDHRICTNCWTSHIDSIINEKPDAEWNLWLKCPTSAFCTASVTRNMIDRFASEEEKSKYNRYLLGSYVEAKKTMKWCPASGCSCAIYLSPGSETSSVTCICLHRFCWNCSKDVHSPVNCESAEKWLAMANNNNQNLDWVLENTVPCPQCQRRIEHHQDFSLKMTCLPPCNYDFCWRCQGDWNEHREGTGCDLYTCIFEAVNYEENRWGEMAEVAADRYRDCHTNWQNTGLSMQNEKAKLQQLNTVIQNLSNTQLATVPQLKFIQEAADQIRECIRILKWSYAYEYYLIDYDEAKQAFLTCTRDTVQFLLEKLRKSVENDLPKFQYGEEEPSENFNEFCIKLTELTSIIREHNERLVRKLENGLANIVPASNRSQRILNGETSVNVRDNIDIPIVVSCPTSPQTPLLDKKF